MSRAPTPISRRALLGTGAAAALVATLPAEAHSMGGQALARDGVHGVLDLPFATKVLMNLPHIVIGGFAAFTGFVLARTWAPVVAIRR